MNNREKYLNSLSDKQIAIMIEETTLFKLCDFYCPIKNCDHKRNGCREKIEKWLGEKA